MPRKGYSIPLTGTVQATLLNPLGLVVRMFVVPYDFRDMPAMSQTFIRQRVLSSHDDRVTDVELNKLTTAQQMKLLRYAIHLRYKYIYYIMMMASYFIFYLLNPFRLQISNVSIGSIGIAHQYPYSDITSH